MSRPKYKRIRAPKKITRLALIAAGPAVASATTGSVVLVSDSENNRRNESGLGLSKETRRRNSTDRFRVAKGARGAAAVPVEEEEEEQHVEAKLHKVNAANLLDHAEDLSSVVAVFPLSYAAKLRQGPRDELRTCKRSKAPEGG